MGLIKNPCIKKVLDVSFEHILESDERLLKNAGKNPISTVYEYDYGYFVVIPQDMDVFEDEANNLKKNGYSEEFISLFLTAKELGCSYLQLDSEGETYSELTKFNWT